jgi:hypothetical protein
VNTRLETKAQQLHIIPFDQQQHKMELENHERLKKIKWFFPREMYNVAFLIGKTSMGRMFSTGFCSNRMIKSISM